MAAGTVIGSAVYQLLIDDQIAKGITGAEREISASAGRIASGLATAEQSTKTLGSSLAGVSGQSKTAGTALEGTASQGRTLGTSLTGVAGESKSAGSALEGAAAQGRTLGSAMGTAAESSRGLGSTLGSVATQAAGFATGMLAMRGISTIFDGLKEATIGYNASLEQTTVAFTGLLGSGDKANAFLKELQAFAAETPFEFGQLTNAAQKLMGVGVAAHDIVPDMRAIGDAVSGMGGNANDIDHVTLALTQMFSSGKIHAQDMLQITSANIPAWQILAREMGKSVEQVQAMSQNNELNSDVYVPKLIAGMEQAYGGQMQEQAKTFVGIVSTLKDNINMTLGTAMKPTFDEAKVELMGLANYTQSPEFQQMAANIGAGAATLAKQIGEFLRTNGPQLVHMLEDAASAGKSIAGYLADVARWATEANDALSGKGFEALGLLLVAQKTGALSLGTSVLGKIPNPLGGGGGGEMAAPGPLPLMNVQADVVNVNGQAVNGGGGGSGLAGDAEKVAGGAGSAAGGGGLIAGATDIAAAAGVVAGTLLAGAAGAVLIDVAGAKALDWLQGHPQAFSSQQQAYQSDMQGIAFTDALQAGRINPPGYQDQSNRQLLEQNTIMQPQAASPDDLKAVNDAIANQNALLAEQAQQLGNVASIQQTQTDKTRENASAVGQAATSDKDATTALDNHRIAQQKLADQTDANAAKMARLKDINEGASNTIQQTTPFVLAQVGAWNAAQTAQEHLTETYQAGLQAMSDYNRQAGEYRGEADAIAAAVQIVQDKQKAGIPLTQEEKTLLGEQAELTKRLVGGQKDATEQAGFAAAANAELMKAQDHLNDLLRDGINSGSDLSDAYKGVEDATAKAAKFGLDPAAQSGSAMNESLSKLQGVVDKDLVPSLDALIKTLGGIPPTHDTKITADNKQAIQSADAVNAKNIADKNLMIGGDNKKALGAIDDVNSATVQNKGISIGGDNSGALGSVAGTNDAHVDNKTLDIYGNNVDALNKLGQVEQFVIHDKTFTITSQTQNIGEGVTAQAGGSPPGGEPRNLIALVNEIGPELIRFPYAGAFAMGGTVGFANGGLPGLTFLPRGAEVIPASRTAQLLDRLSQAQAMWQGGGATGGGGGGITINLPSGAVQVQAGASAEEVARVAGAQVYELVLSGLNSSAAQYAGPNAPGTV